MTKSRPSRPRRRINKVEAKQDLDSYLDETLVTHALHHAREFARLSVGKRGTLLWLEHLKRVGALLCCLDDEEWQQFVTQYKQAPAPSPPKYAPSPSKETLPTPLPSVGVSDTDDLF